MIIIAIITSSKILWKISNICKGWKNCIATVQQYPYTYHVESIINILPYLFYHMAGHLFIHLSSHKSILFLKQIIIIYSVLQITNENTVSVSKFLNTFQCACIHIKSTLIQYIIINPLYVWGTGWSAVDDTKISKTCLSS